MISRWEQGGTEIPPVRGSGATGAGLTSTTLRHPALSSVPTAVATRLLPPKAGLASRIVRNPVADQEIRGHGGTTGQASTPVCVPASGPPGDVAGVTGDSMTRGHAVVRSLDRARRTGPAGRLDFVRRAACASWSATPPPAWPRSAGREASISRRRQIFRTKGVTTVPEVRIVAEPRTEFGKGAARRTRRGGRVPAIVYGHGTDTRHITLPGHDLMMALKTPNVLIRVDGLPGGNQLTLPKAVQRNPIRGFIEHVDLIMVRRGEKVTVEVPVQVTGEVFSGGLLDQQLVQVAVEAEATNIPNAFEVDVEGMEIGAAVRAGELTLPAGVTLVMDPDALVLHVLAAPTAEQIEADLGEVPAAEEAEEVPPSPEEAAEGAPAASGQAAETPAERSG